MTNEIFGESDMCFQYGKSSDGELFMISNIPFTVSLWTPGDATTYSKGSLITEDGERTINPTVTFSFPAGATTVDAMMSLEFEQQIYDHLKEKGYTVNPRAAVPSVDEVAQARQRVEQSAPAQTRPQSVDDLNPKREPHVQTMSENPNDDLLKTTIIAVERVKSSNGSTGYKLYRENDGQRQSVGAVWIEKLTKGLEGAVTKDITALDIGDMTSIPPVTAFYKKGKPTGQGGFYNDFVRFEVAS